MRIPKMSKIQQAHKLEEQNNIHVFGCPSGNCSSDMKAKSKQTLVTGLKSLTFTFFCKTYSTQ